MKWIALLAGLVLGLPAFAGSEGLNTNLLHEGDLIFQETNSEQGLALKAATKSRYTHVGIIIRSKGAWAVFEAVEPVSIIGLDQFIARGVNRHLVVKRVRDHDLLNPTSIKHLIDYGARFMGKHYDFVFSWKDDQIYCTELVYKVYVGALNYQISTLDRLKDFDLANETVKRLLTKRYGNRIPYDETVLSVATLFNSPKLVLVVAVN